MGPRSTPGPGGGGGSEGKGPGRRPQERLGRRLEEVAKAVGGGFCRLQMPLRLALGVRGTVAGHRLGDLGGGGSPLPMHPMHPCGEAGLRSGVKWGGGGASKGQFLFFAPASVQSGFWEEMGAGPYFPELCVKSLLCNSRRPAVLLVGLALWGLIRGGRGLGLGRFCTALNGFP